MDKKAQGLPLNTIIIAAIALIVLVVLVAIFGGQIANWVGSVGEAEQATCANLGGQEVSSTKCPIDGRIYGAKNVTTGKVCCSPEKIIT